MYVEITYCTQAGTVYTRLTIPILHQSMIPKQNDIRPLCATAGTCSAAKQCLEPAGAADLHGERALHRKDVNQKNGAVVLNQKNWDLQGFTRHMGV